MPYISKDRVKDTTTTTGTGALTLANSAPVGFRTFGSVMATGDTCIYCISSSGGTEWEVGLGTYTSAGTVLTRTTVFESSNAGAAVAFSGGTKDVFMTVNGFSDNIILPSGAQLQLNGSDPNHGIKYDGTIDGPILDGWSGIGFRTNNGGAKSIGQFAVGGLVMQGADTSITLKGVTNEPSTPASGDTLIYNKVLLGRGLTCLKYALGSPEFLQSALWQGNFVRWTPTTSATGVVEGTGIATTGTATMRLPTTTNLYTVVKRARWANVVTTLNQVLGARTTEAMFFLGDTANQGGFYCHARCGFDVWTNGARFFAGLHTATTVISADPSALNNTVGFCIDAADNGAISFLMRGTAATKTATGFTAATNKGYDMFMYCPPNSTTVYWRIVELNSLTEASGNTSTNAPAVNTMLTYGVLASNAALTPVTSVQLGLGRFYVQTEY